VVRPTVDGVLASLLREEVVGRTLPERFCATCLMYIDVTSVALTLAGADVHHLLVACSDPQAGRLGELESTLGEGPGIEANRSGGPVLVTDLWDRKATSCWPAYTSAATEAPVRSQFSFPLQIGIIRLGVLTLYRARPAALSQNDMVCALVLADVATVLLLHLQDASADAGDLHVEMGTAFVATAELHQATGMVSVQASVGMSEALLLLHARAYSSDRTSLAVARDVLAGTINFRGGRRHDGQE
jgi:hypothetical protein